MIAQDRYDAARQSEQTAKVGAGVGGAVIAGVVVIAATILIIGPSSTAAPILTIVAIGLILGLAILTFLVRRADTPRPTTNPTGASDELLTALRADRVAETPLTAHLDDKDLGR